MRRGCTHSRGNRSLLPCLSPTVPEPGLCPVRTCWRMARGLRPVPRPHLGLGGADLGTRTCHGQGQGRDPALHPGGRMVLLD